MVDCTRASVAAESRDYIYVFICVYTIIFFGYYMCVLTCIQKMNSHQLHTQEQSQQNVVITHIQIFVNIYIDVYIDICICIEWTPAVSTRSSVAAESRDFARGCTQSNGFPQISTCDGIAVESGDNINILHACRGWTPANSARSSVTAESRNNYARERCPELAGRAASEFVVAT